MWHQILLNFIGIPTLLKCKPVDNEKAQHLRTAPGLVYFHNPYHGSQVCKTQVKGDLNYIGISTACGAHI